MLVYILYRYIGIKQTQGLLLEVLSVAKNSTYSICVNCHLTGVPVRYMTFVLCSLLTIFSYSMDYGLDFIMNHEGKWDVMIDNSFEEDIIITPGSNLFNDD